MAESGIQEKIFFIESRRESLVKLLEQPNLGVLRVDVNQALEELDELIEELRLIFPTEPLRE